MKLLGFLDIQFFLKIQNIIITANPRSKICELNFWLLFFLTIDLNNSLACTNAQLREKSKQISKHEFYTVTVCHEFRCLKSLLGLLVTK